MPNKVFANIIRLQKFKRDLKNLKRFRSLDEDIETFTNVQLKRKHKQRKETNGIERISNLGIENPEIYKVTRFACKSLKGRGVMSGIRIIYAYFEKEDKLEFVEIYFKGDKVKEDRDRIKSYYNE
ncbi:MAG: hypothetical protein ABH844_05695 [Candidatus Omnitrophota bacterium]